MKVSEAFLVNTKNFDAIIDTLVQHEAEETVINSALLEDLSYSDPNDLLVVRILKDFKVIDNDGKPSTHFEEFNNPQTTKIALAKGLATAYEGLFDKYPKIHQASPDKVKEAFEDIFNGKKTNLIIKYITGTFDKIVSYVGVSTIDTILSGEPADKVTLETSTVEAEQVESRSNGVHKTGDKTKIDTKGDKDGLEPNFPSEDTPEETAPDDTETDLTVREFIKNDDTDDEIEDDPFDFGDDEEPSQESETDAAKKQIDVDPVDLDIPLSTATTQNTNSMENVTTDHKFVQKALFRKSDLLQKMNRWEELVPTLEEIIKRYDNEEHIGLKEAVSRSIIRRATALLKLDKTEEALPALNSVISRFKDSEKKEFYDQASRAMLYKSTILEKNGNGNLLPLYNAIIDRLDSNSEILMKEKLDEIHLKRFDLITEEGDNSTILDACTKLIERFKDDNERRDYLQKAMIIRAETLDALGQDEDALEAYDEFLEIFGN